MIPARDYLSQAGASRALFIEMFRAGMSVLPPTLEGTYQVEDGRSMTDLAEALGVSRSTVLMDLKRLTNYGWINDVKRKGRVWRMLGQRIDGFLYLIADTAAKLSTGDDRLVSTKILNVDTAPKPIFVEREQPKKASNDDGRGPGRRWGD